MPVYNAAKELQLKDGIGWLTNNIHVVLTTSSHVIDTSNDTYLSDINANEVSGTGYPAGGPALTSKTVTVNVADAPNIVLNITGTISNIGNATLYVNTGDPATSTLLASEAFSPAKSVTDDTLTIEFDATGILRVN